VVQEVRERCRRAVARGPCGPQLVPKLRRLRESDLPPLEREADRAPRLQFWALVLRAVAAEWLSGDRAWFDNVESRLRG
jgi:hypothetical protein